MLNQSQFGGLGLALKPQNGSQSPFLPVECSVRALHAALPLGAVPTIIISMIIAIINNLWGLLGLSVQQELKLDSKRA